MTFSQHPLSAAFPPMAPDEYQALVDSIIDIGVQNPITLLDGMVIDGWHRYRAATEAGMACPSVELGDVDPKDFVMAQNKARRHVTKAQLAMATTAVYAWKPHGGDRRSESTGTECPLKSTAELSEISGVGERTIKQAKTVTAQAAPAVVDAVKRGELGLPKAAAIAKLPLDEQAAALHQPAPKPVKAVPVAEPEQPDAPPEYTALDAASEQISDLQAELVIARMGDVSDAEKQQAAELIADLRAEIKTLAATLKATQLSRDSLLEENAQLKRQCLMNNKKLKSLS